MENYYNSRCTSQTKYEPKTTPDYHEDEITDTQDLIEQKIHKFLDSLKLR
jgi:hypothetical protein